MQMENNELIYTDIVKRRLVLISILQVHVIRGLIALGDERCTLFCCSKLHKKENANIQYSDQSQSTSETISQRGFYPEKPGV